MNWFSDLMSSKEYKNLSSDKKEELFCVLSKMADDLISLHPDKYDIQKEKSESIVYGWHFTEDSAKKAVSKLKNADGTSGEYWTLKDVEDVAKAMNIDWARKSYNLYDLYYTLNLERSIHYEQDLAPQTYVKRAFQFLDDKNAPEGKAKRYYVLMNSL